MSEHPVSYKTKPDKHKYRRRNKSLDEVHNDRVKEFQKNQSRLPYLEDKLKEMEEELNAIVTSGATNMDIEITSRKSELRKKIKQIQREIATYANYEEELEYFSRAGEVLFEYYDETNGAFYNNDLEDLEDPVIKEPSKIKISDALAKLNAENRKKRKRQPRKKQTGNATRIQNNGIMAMLFGGEKKQKSKEDIQNIKCRAKLEDQYLTIVDKEYNNHKMGPVTRCPECDTERIIMYAESRLVCPECGITEEIMIESEAPSQRENYNEKTKYPYQRLAHFVEKLNQFLCKGNVNIPDTVYRAIESEMNKYSYTEKDVTIKFLEKSLRKHNLSSHYEDTMYIYCKIRKVDPLTIKRDEYDAMIKMFQRMDEVYEKFYKPNDRSNFLRYTVAMYRLFLILGKDEHANSLKLLKDTEKMKEQFKIIDKIFDHLGWEYDKSYHNISQLSTNSRIVSSRSKFNYQNRYNISKNKNKKTRSKSESKSEPKRRRVRRVRKSSSRSSESDNRNKSPDTDLENEVDTSPKSNKKVTGAKRRYELNV
jgi:Poxvirus Late Transcription Factor VLTF3 like